MEVKLDDEGRKPCIPCVYVRGTYYQVGFSVGQAFRGLIEDYLAEYTDFKECIALLDTSDGRRIFDESLKVSEARFSEYVQELRGLADGAKIPFEHIYALNIENLLNPCDPPDDAPPRRLDEGCKGCTSIINNEPERLFLGHTEDAPKHMTNTFYIVSAEIIDSNGLVIENFATLCYPGAIFGGTMGFNRFGVVHSINSLFPKKCVPERSPHLFLLRALLKARSLGQILEVVKDVGSGSADGFGVNVIVTEADGFSEAYNIEVSPGQNGKLESEVSVEKIAKGAAYPHCNQYLRCKVPEKAWFVTSSHERHLTIQKFPGPHTLEGFKEVFSQEVPDGQDKVKYSIFKRALKSEDHYATIAFGLFDLKAGTWSLYKHAPNSNPPVAVIPINFQH